ncbi:hypothetical protein [Microbacterium sp. EF45047]|uniref:hypothetical protein n=1 Tax=Microbacterium sp. EF45047 TaxID=2809708 RepID=UPI0023491222|nr:hypothetical protein [Microbacterium sp. EF45047]
MLLLHDRAAVAQLGERLGQGATEARAHAGGEDDGLKSHEILLRFAVDSFTVGSSTGHLFVPLSC